jgi:hypothetical protein
VDDNKIIRWTGIFGLVGAILGLAELPLWVIPGTPPPIRDGAGFAKYLADSRPIALTRVLIDVLMYITFMVFYAGFRHLLRQTRKEYEWLATLNFGAAVVWWTVILVAGGLEASAVLDTVRGGSDPSVVRALVEGTLVLYNALIALAVTALFMGTAGFAILATGALPRWIGWLAWTSVVMCFFAMPAIYRNRVDTNDFYNAAGWGPGVIIAIPTLIWSFSASIAMIQKSYTWRKLFGKSQQ